MSIHQSGYKNVISVPNGASGTNLTYLDAAIELFEEDTKFLIAVDNDEQGIKLEKELYEEALQYIREHPEDFLANLIEQTIRISLTNIIIEDDKEC